MILRETVVRAAFLLFFLLYGNKYQTEIIEIFTTILKCALGINSLDSKGFANVEIDGNVTCVSKLKGAIAIEQGLVSPICEDGVC
jgi:hypothetical protein